MFSRRSLFLMLVVGMFCSSLAISPMVTATVEVLEGFESSYTIWIKDLAIDENGVTTTTTNVTEGARSLYVPIDNPLSYGSGSIGWEFDVPADISTFDNLIVDLYFPNINNFLSPYGDGKNVNIGISDSGGEQYIYAVPLSPGASGWNQVSVAVSSITRNVSAITKMRVTVYTQSGAAGSYFLVDNVRAKSAAAYKVSAESFIVFQDGEGNIKAQNGLTGAIDYSSTNAVTVIQSAINRLANGGGKVTIKEGTYICTTSIDIRDNIILEGVGKATVLKLKDSTTLPVFYTNWSSLIRNVNTLTAPGNNNFAIRDLVIDVNKANQTPPSGDVYFYCGIYARGNNFMIENVVVKNAASFGVAIHAWEPNPYVAPNLYLNNVAAENCGDGHTDLSGGFFFSAAVNNSNFNNLLAKGCNKDGIVFEDRCKDSAINDAVCQDNVRHGIRIVNNWLATGFSVDAICINNGGDGLNIAASDSITISGTYSQNGLNGINLNSENHTLNGVICQGNDECGLLLDGPKHTVSGGTFMDNGKDAGALRRAGIYLTATGRRCTIMGVNVSDWQTTKTQQYGIQEQTDASDTNPNVIIGFHAFGNVVDSASLRPESKSMARHNIGYVTENCGTAGVVNGGTIAHGLVSAPTAYSVTATVSGHIATVTSANATSLTIGLHNHNGSAITSPENVSWRAEIK